MIGGVQLDFLEVMGDPGEFLGRDLQFRWKEDIPDERDVFLNSIRIGKTPP